MRKLIALVALLAVALYPSAARAGIWKVNIKNETTHCAWITLYVAHGFGPWTISGHPGFIGPHSEKEFAANSFLDFKIRAEVKASGACTNTNNIADTYDERKTLTREGNASFNAHLVNNNGRFNLWFIP